jgi:hypothetical protein
MARRSLQRWTIGVVGVVVAVVLLDHFGGRRVGGGSESCMHWTRDLPPASGTFMGRQLRAVVEGCTVRADGPTPRDLAFLDEIVASLGVALPRAQSELAQYEESAGREYAAHVKNPHIWIRDDRETPQEWTLVVERDDSLDFGWHIEFEGSKFRELWAAD